jgi:hypothetical protein
MIYLILLKSATAPTTFQSNTSFMGCVSLAIFANSVTDTAQSSGWQLTTNALLVGGEEADKES